MFARRRSFCLFPCFNVAFVTCCLLVIGNVSSMTLERQRRQFQQQNDKQLEYSELILPEAESEILQNDMELVPAIDGNSDMYLLVPASAAANQEQSLQALSEVSENQKSDNVESNSDMLMQESEDTPEVQILELPEDAIETSIHNELVANNKLDEEADFESVSENVLNDIAEAAKEIQNEIENELEGNEENEEKAEKEEQENQDMIGVVLEEPKKTAEITFETPQATNNVLYLIKAEDENANKESSEKETAESYFMTPQQHKSDELETEDGKVEENHTKLEIDLKENENVEKINEAEEQHSDEEGSETKEEEAINENDLESQEKNQTVEDKNTFNLHDEMGTTNEPQLVEEIKFPSRDVQDISNESEIEANEDQLEEVKTETDKSAIIMPEGAENIQSNFKETVQNERIQDDIESPSMEALASEKIQLPEPEIESLVESQTLAEPIETLKQNSQEIIYQGELGENVDIDEVQPVEENSSNLAKEPEELNALSEIVLIGPTQTIEEHQAIKESSIPDEQPNEESLEFEVNKYKEQEKIDELQLSGEKQDAHSLQTQNAEVFHPLELETEHTELNDKVQPEQESQSFEVTEKTENMESNESPEPFQVEQMSEDTKKFEETQNEPLVEGNQYDKELLAVHNTQADEEAQYEDKTESVEQSFDNVQSSEIESYKPENEIQKEIETQIHDNSKISEEILTKDEIKIEEQTQNFDEIKEDNEDDQTFEKFQLIDNVQTGDRDHSDDDFSNKSEEQQTEASNFESDEAAKPEEPKESLSEAQDHTEVSISSAEVQQTDNPEFVTEQEDFEMAAVKPADISLDEILPEESYKPEEEEDDTSHINKLADEDILQNIEENQNAQEQYETATTQQSLEDQNNLNESANVKETTFLSQTVTQLATNNQLPLQHEEHEQEKVQDQQIVAEQIVSSITSKPLNVMDSVLNYVNASLMNHMSNSNKQGNKAEEQIFSSKLRRYDGAQVWRIVVQNDKERKLADELQTKYDGQLWKEVKQEVDYLLKPQVLADAEQHVRAANLSRIVLIDNLQKVIEVENPPAEEIEALQNRKGSRLTWQAYHRLDDIHSYMDVMAKTYPDICSTEIIGYSIEKRPLKILKISNGNANNPGIWIDGGMHAREWVSPAVVTYIANQIIEGWDDLPAHMRNINWYIHAVANPDGYEYSHTTDRLWRKNMRSHGRACPGVDLNRNFGYKWGGKGTSANPCSQTYRGSKAFSEPETFYISKFISNFPRETFKAYLSFHSYGQYILYPWGYDYHVTKDMADLDLVARQAGTIITKSTGAKFTVGSSATTLYPAAGGSDDWAKGIAGIKYSYTIEMGDTGRYGFVLPADLIEPNGKNGFTVVQTVAKAITMGKNARRRKLKARKTH